MMKEGHGSTKYLQDLIGMLSTMHLIAFPLFLGVNIILPMHVCMYCVITYSDQQVAKYQH